MMNKRMTIDEFQIEIFKSDLLNERQTAVLEQAADRGYLLDLAVPVSELLPTRYWADADDPEQTVRSVHDQFWPERNAGWLIDEGWWAGLFRELGLGCIHWRDVGPPSHFAVWDAYSGLVLHRPSVIVGPFIPLHHKSYTPLGVQVHCWGNDESFSLTSEGWHSLVGLVAKAALAEHGPQWLHFDGRALTAHIAREDAEELAVALSDLIEEVLAPGWDTPAART